MKSLLLILFLAASAFAENVVVINPGEVQIDGKNVGDLVSVCANAASTPGRASALLAAVNAWAQSLTDASAAAQAQAAADVAAITKKCEAIIAKLKDPAATKDDAAAEADKTENARKRDELQKQKDEADAKAAEIQAQLDAIPADAANADALKLKAAAKIQPTKKLNH